MASNSAPHGHYFLVQVHIFEDFREKSPEPVFKSTLQQLEQCGTTCGSSSHDQIFASLQNTVSEAIYPSPLINTISFIKISIF